MGLSGQEIFPSTLIVEIKVPILKRHFPPALHFFRFVTWLPARLIDGEFM